MKEEKWLIGVDLGGTTIKLSFLDFYGEIISKWEIPTDKSEAGRHITTHIARAIDDKMEEMNVSRKKFSGIGMGAPGFIEMDSGFIYHAVNIGWRDFPLKDKLEVETGLPVIIDNDANIAALGEMWRGAGDGARDLLCVTLGTGVGGGIITNGTIIHGTNGMAGEIGHITSIPDGGAQCNCGKTGCLETVASATGVVRIAMEKLMSHQDSVLYHIYQEKNEITSRDIFEGAEAEDPYAVEVVNNVSFHLGLAIANLANSLNPSKIVIGGGVSKAGEALLTPLKKQFEKYALPRVREGADFAIATLGNDAGVIGGAWLVKTKLMK
ncbi:ROK family glucokinase [Alkalihalobacillus hwajinpoensis]|uniref:ROK family glucokinase n=1 Tax=Guptibacillus hwajinpoensis TaxID=208199 RepID=UPI0018840864|nr:ROK family glucokinase [Pseudalkalibacillus hwajinpoensis]MBF0709269.1 ROK family glucokinase [Pseudalkalibacillus hwajinpoensis]